MISFYHNKDSWFVCFFSLALLLGVSLGCSVYFNTFFNARKFFNHAEDIREQSDNRPGSGRNDYNKAIEKALKVVENHPNSKYYDDAVYILAVSYYHTGQYSRAERRFIEILANYGDSEWAKESRLYLAQSRLALGDVSDAMQIFEEIFEENYARDYKAEAAIALGEYYYGEKDYDRAQQYFKAVRDSLGDDDDMLTAQIYLADSYFENFRFRDGLSGYLQILGMDPDTKQKYHALYRAAICSYRFQRIDDGQAYLQQLMDDELYFDSLGSLKLTMAEGYELDDDLLQAEIIYEDVAETSERPYLKGMANYRLGLIYQIDYDDLVKAKQYYDEAAKTSRATVFGKDVIQRSSDIGKLEKFARSTLDSSATMAAIDDAAFTQYALAELFWFKLDKPDTAIVEMQYLVDSFPDSYIAPKGFIALSQMYREHLEDDKTADSLLRFATKKYPQSDYLPEILSPLGLEGSAVDTGYAKYYLDKAERLLIDEDNPDSARYFYQIIVDNFPDSRFYLRARFAMLWITENYSPPADSSLYYEYSAFVDSFPNSEFTNIVLTKLGRVRQIRQVRQVEEVQPDSMLIADSISAGKDTVSDTANTYLDPTVTLYLRPNGDSLVDLKLKPIEIIEKFVFPDEAALVDRYEWRLYYQLLIDYSGKVIEYILKIPSGDEIIDERANITVESMTFDGMAVSNRVISSGHSEAAEGEGYWFVYEYTVIKPEHLR